MSHATKTILREPMKVPVNTRAYHMILEGTTKSYLDKIRKWENKGFQDHEIIDFLKEDLNQDADYHGGAVKYSSSSAVYSRKKRGILYRK